METSNEYIDRRDTRFLKSWFGPSPWSRVVNHAWYRSGVMQKPRRHAVTQSQPAQVRRFATNQLDIVAGLIAQP